MDLDKEQVFVIRKKGIAITLDLYNEETGKLESIEFGDPIKIIDKLLLLLEEQEIDFNIN